MPIISHFISAIILLHMFVNKGKVNTSRHFSYAASLEKSQHNMATLPPIFLDKPVFSSKKFQTPPPPPSFPSILKKSNLPIVKHGGVGGRGGRSNYKNQPGLTYITLDSSIFIIGTYHLLINRNKNLDTYYFCSDKYCEFFTVVLFSGEDFITLCVDQLIMKRLSLID